MLTFLSPAEPLNGVEDKMSPLIASHEYKGCTIKISRGDYSGLLKRVVENLEKAVVRKITQINLKIILKTTEESCYHHPFESLQVIIAQHMLLQVQVRT